MQRTLPKSLQAPPPLESRKVRLGAGIEFARFRPLLTLCAWNASGMLLVLIFFNDFVLDLLSRLFGGYVNPQVMEALTELHFGSVNASLLLLLINGFASAQFASLRRDWTRGSIGVLDAANLSYALHFSAMAVMCILILPLVIVKPPKQEAQSLNKRHATQTVDIQLIPPKKKPNAKAAKSNNSKKGTDVSKKGGESKPNHRHQNPFVKDPNCPDPVGDGGSAQLLPQGNQGKTAAKKGKPGKANPAKTKQQAAKIPVNKNAKNDPRYCTIVAVLSRSGTELPGNWVERPLCSGAGHGSWCETSRGEIPAKRYGSDQRVCVVQITVVDGLSVSLLSSSGNKDFDKFALQNSDECARYHFRLYQEHQTASKILKEWKGAWQVTFTYTPGTGKALTAGPDLAISVW